WSRRTALHRRCACRCIAGSIVRAAPSNGACCGGWTSGSALRTSARPGSTTTPRSCEVHMEAWMPGEPRFDRWRLVRAVVVHHQMHVQLGRHPGIDGAQEPQELGTTVAPMQLADHFAG